MGKLQADYQAFQEIVQGLKAGLDVSEAKWDEYEQQYAKCSQWLDNMEPTIASFSDYEDDLVTKRTRLEEFQSAQLRDVFETQSEFSRLNLKAQLLLETSSNSSISNAVTQLSARYNAVVISAKDILHSLEQVT